MKELECVFMGNQQPYPMYFTLRGKDGAKFMGKVFNADGSVKTKDNKPVEGQYASGTSLITMAHNDGVVAGDSILINQVKHVIDEIIEQRKPKGHHPENVIWYKVNASYTRFIG